MWFVGGFLAALTSTAEGKVVGLRGKGLEGVVARLIWRRQTNLDVLLSHLTLLAQYHTEHSTTYGPIGDRSSSHTSKKIDHNLLEASGPPVTYPTLLCAFFQCGLLVV